MPTRSAAERTYLAIKADILTGAAPKGRLDIQRLGDRLRVSQTPVREALARLAGEHLVTVTPNQGFAVAQLSAQDLRDLYVWSSRIALMALDGMDVSISIATAPQSQWSCAPATETTHYAHALSILFWDIANLQSNRELIDKIAQSNDRLFAPRMCEPIIIRGAEVDAQLLQDAWSARDRPRLATLVRGLCASRVAKADLIAACLHDQRDARASL